MQYDASRIHSSVHSLAREVEMRSIKMTLNLYDELYTETGTELYDDKKQDMSEDAVITGTYVFLFYIQGLV